jgi:hypothetical protein
MHPPRGALRTVNFPTAAFIFQKHYNPQLQVYCNQENIRYLSFRHSSADGNSCVPHRAAFSLSFTPNLIIPFCCDCAATPMIAQVPSAVAVLWIRKIAGRLAALPPQCGGLPQLQRIRCKAGECGDGCRRRDQSDRG